jgi:hypothetical protein
VEIKFDKKAIAKAEEAKRSSGQHSGGKSGSSGFRTVGSSGGETKKVTLSGGNIPVGAGGSRSISFAGEQTAGGGGGAAGVMSTLHEERSRSMRNFGGSREGNSPVQSRHLLKSRSMLLSEEEKDGYALPLRGSASSRMFQSGKRAGDISSFVSS